jgi:lipocalin
MKNLIWVPRSGAMIMAFQVTSMAGDIEFKKPFTVVDHVHLDSYFGLGHEGIRIQNKFQDNEPSPGGELCFDTIAEYFHMPKNRVGVQNICYHQSGAEVAKPKAKVVRGSINAKLKVNFTGTPRLDGVGVRDGAFWVHSRTQVLAENDIDAGLSVAGTLGYDIKFFSPFRGNI